VPGAPCGRIVRLNPLVGPVYDERRQTYLPPASMTENEFNRLARLDMDVVAVRGRGYHHEYAHKWLQDEAPNQPIRMDGDTLALEVGHLKAGLAIDWWQRIAGTTQSEPVPQQATHRFVLPNSGMHGRASTAPLAEPEVAAAEPAVEGTPQAAPIAAVVAAPAAAVLSPRTAVRSLARV